MARAEDNLAYMDDAMDVMSLFDGTAVQKVSTAMPKEASDYPKLPKISVPKKQSHVASQEDKKNRAVEIYVVALVAVLGLVVVISYARNYELKRNLTQAQKQLSVLEQETELYRIRNLEVLDAGTLMQYASEELDMQTPQANSILAVRLSPQSYTVDYTENATQRRGLNFHWFGKRK